MLVQEKKSNLVFLMETKIVANKIEIAKRIISFKGCIVVNVIGSKGGLALLWRNRDQVEVDNYSQYHILAWVTDPVVNSKWLFTGFYGKPKTSIR